MSATSLSATIPWCEATNGRKKDIISNTSFSINLSSINIFQFWKEKKIYNNISMAIQSQKKGEKEK